MKAVLLGIAGFVAGLVVSLIGIIALEIFDAAVFPPPPDFKGTYDEMCQYVAAHPAWVLAVAVAAWGVSAFVGAWVARKLGGFYPAAILALLLLAGLVLNISMLPYPIWFKAATLVVIPIALLLGCGLLPRRPRTEANSKTALDGSK